MNKYLVRYIEQEWIDSELLGKRWSTGITGQTILTLDPFSLEDKYVNTQLNKGVDLKAKRRTFTDITKLD